MKIELDRRDVCALMLACTCCDIAHEEGYLRSSTKWKALHEKLEEQVIKYDEKHTKEA